MSQKRKPSKKKRTKSQIGISKELSRIKRQVNALKKRGYIVPDLIPQRESYKTSSGYLSGLRSITLRKIYQQSLYVIPETGEVVSGFEGKIYEQKQRGKKKPKIVLLDKIAESIENLPDTKKVWIGTYSANQLEARANHKSQRITIDLRPYKRDILDLISNKRYWQTQEATRQEALDYEKYLQEHISELESIFVVIQYQSQTETEFIDSITSIIHIINGAPLTMDMSRSLGELEGVMTYDQPE